MFMKQKEVWETHYNLNINQAIYLKLSLCVFPSSLSPSSHTVRNIDKLQDMGGGGETGQSA